MKKSKKKKFLFNLYFFLPKFKLGKKVKKGEDRGDKVCKGSRVQDKEWHKIRYSLNFH